LFEKGFSFSEDGYYRAYEYKIFAKTGKWIATASSVFYLFYDSKFAIDERDKFISKAELNPRLGIDFGTNNAIIVLEVHTLPPQTSFRPFRLHGFSQRGCHATTR
jgi:hypothetical protein